MQILVQLMMGTSLAACAGLRAMLPLLVLGLLDRAGYAHLSAPFSFLARTDVLVILGVAAVLEILADKIPAVDHALDGMATVVRPLAGTVLASSMLSGLDPALALLLGLVVGGGTALTVHAGKATVRVKSSAAAVVHGGFGNTVISTLEDIAIGVIMWLTMQAPLLAFALVVCMLGMSIWLLVHMVRIGARIIKRRAGAGAAGSNHPPTCSPTSTAAPPS